MTLYSGAAFSAKSKEIASRAGMPAPVPVPYAWNSPRMVLPLGSSCVNRPAGPVAPVAPLAPGSPFGPRSPLGPRSRFAPAPPAEPLNSATVEGESFDGRTAPFLQQVAHASERHDEGDAGQDHGR